MTPNDLSLIIELSGKIYDTLELIREMAFDESYDCPVPDNVRPATLSDMVVGAVIWYPKRKPYIKKWNIVSRVRYPVTDVEVYIDTAGCMFDLVGGYVEVT